MKTDSLSMESRDLSPAVNACLRDEAMAFGLRASENVETTVGLAVEVSTAYAGIRRFYQ